MTKMELQYGIDRIDIVANLLDGRRIGLITNPTGVTRDLVPTVDVINQKFNLTCLFAPEHGVRGTAQAGDHVGDSVDEKTGVPVFSLYGATQHLTEKMLSMFDVLVFDVQDIGARFYTYISTLAYAMQDCAAAKKEVFVLDRPNPLSSKVEGSVLDERFSSFVGLYPIATRHGLTIGEYAQMINSEYGIGAKLYVVPMRNYRPKKYFDDYDIEFISPSPNIPRLETAMTYIGTCLFEGTNVSEGRGTTHPFEMIGAPWLRPEEVISRVNDKMLLQGVKLRECAFVPSFSKFAGEVCRGIQIHIQNRRLFESFKVGLCLVDSIRELHNEFEFLPASGQWDRPFIDLLLGGDELRRDNFDFIEYASRMVFYNESYKSIAEKYYMYL